MGAGPHGLFSKRMEVYVKSAQEISDDHNEGLEVGAFEMLSTAIADLI